MKKKRLQQTRARIKEYLVLIDSLKKDCEEKFIADPVYRGAILHYLYPTRGYKCLVGCN